MISKYIWLILKFIISGIILYVIYLDIILIIGYDELEKIAKMDNQEFMHYTSELGLFNLVFFAFAGILEFIKIFGNIYLIFFPFLITALNIILSVLIFLALLIFKEEFKSLIISSLIISSCAILVLNGF